MTDNINWVYDKLYYISMPAINEKNIGIIYGEFFFNMRITQIEEFGLSDFIINYNILLSTLPKEEINRLTLLLK